MNFQLRKKLILQTLDLQGTVEVKEFAELLQTSEITVRRDLGVLAEEGLLFRTHGGAMKLSLAQTPVHFTNKAVSRAEEKDYICRKAAANIEDGETIFLDCGSTLARLCPYIKHKYIKVITNSLPIVYELMDTNVSINLVGGEVDMQRQAVHGMIALEHLARYRADKAFIGVDGVSLAKGLTAASEKEASIATAMASHAKEVFLLCDSSKLEKDNYIQFAPLSMVTTLITDAHISPELLARYEATNLKVIC